MMVEIVVDDDDDDDHEDAEEDAKEDKEEVGSVVDDGELALNNGLDTRTAIVRIAPPMMLTAETSKPKTRR